MMIELGGGTNPHPRADVVIDLRHPKNAPAQDASETPWQVWPKDSQRPCHIANLCYDEVYASHFMEHIAKGRPIINVMNEAWRVLKPGGTFTMIMPLIGWTREDGVGRLVNRWEPYADPTHVQGWWLPESLQYFCEGSLRADADYGIKRWAPLGPFVQPNAVFPYLHTSTQESFWSVRDGWEGIARLVKP
jgi:hypothetical protein